MEYLYHYTNVSSLALILKSKNFRFNSLLYMDDKEEVFTNEEGYLGKYCFVSSWTDLEEESIPFWGIYTKDMGGVRIKLQKNPFVKNEICYYRHEETNFISQIPKYLFDELDKYNVYVPMDFLRKVVYTDNESLIMPKTINYVKSFLDGTSLLIGDFMDVGKYKRKCWEFQSEWRYSIVVFPCNENGQLTMSGKNDLNDLGISYIDVPMEEAAFKSMEITLGPKISESDRIIVKLLVEKYCPTAQIKKSKLEIR